MQGYRHRFELSGETRELVHPQWQTTVVRIWLLQCTVSQYIGGDSDLCLWLWRGFCCVWRHHRRRWHRRSPGLGRGSVCQGAGPEAQTTRWFHNCCWPIAIQTSKTTCSIWSVFIVTRKVTKVPEAHRDRWARLFQIGSPRLEGFLSGWRSEPHTETSSWTDRPSRCWKSGRAKQTVQNTGMRGGNRHLSHDAISLLRVTS